jgi:hypothetical protein
MGTISLFFVISLLGTYIVTLFIQLMLFAILKHKHKQIWLELGKPSYVWVNSVMPGDKVKSLVWRTDMYIRGDFVVVLLCCALRVGMLGFLVMLAVLLVSLVFRW